MLAVKGLAVLKPDVIVAERAVAKAAKDNLQDRQITLALNVKRSVLDALARTTGAEVLKCPYF